LSHFLRKRTVTCRFALVLLVAALQAKAAFPMVANGKTIFVGQTTLLADRSPACRPAGPLTIVVQGGRFEIPWNDQKFHATVRSDGSFFSVAGSPLGLSDKHVMMVPTLQGRISNGVLAADWGTRLCHYQIEAVAS
jgi:hypothetical protein